MWKTTFEDLGDVKMGTKAKVKFFYDGVLKEKINFRPSCSCMSFSFNNGVLTVVINVKQKANSYESTKYIFADDDELEIRYNAVK